MLLKTRIAKSGFTALAAIGFIMSSQLSIAAGGSESKGLPQLDISTWPNQLLWLAATFLVGYLLMAKPAPDPRATQASGPWYDART